jgi:hypothetical protein
MLLDLIALDDSSRVWIYQADRFLAYDELDKTRELLFPFLQGWVSHDNKLATYGNVFHRRFLALFVDESQAHSASGCSIDASVRFVKELGANLGVDFFSRMTYCYLQDDEVQSVEHATLPKLYASGDVDDETIFFDNLVKDKGQFLQHWTRPLKDSWHYRFV